jgi:16S rRNA (guanine527-N7)-methyltransferase
MGVGSEEWKRYLRQGAEALDIAVTDGQLEAFSLHARELLFWNRRTNLTAITDPAQVAVKHFVDSLVPARLIPAGAAVLDIGSGAGFPGIPLKVVLPNLRATLVDAVGKKVTFLGHVIRLLGLTDIHAVHFRTGQPMTADQAREVVGQGYDIVISRALGSPEALAPMALPLLREQGMIISMRGKGAPALDAIDMRIGPLIVVDACDYRLPYDGPSRSLWCLKAA